MIPGLNLLNVAFGAIAQQMPLYIKATGRALDDAGVWITSFADPVQVRASVQTVEQEAYVELGLDMRRSYLMIFSNLNPADSERGESADRFAYGGRLYEVEKTTPWNNQDGWSYCRVVDIGAYAP